MKHIGRRDFIASAALIAVSAPLWSRARGDAPSDVDVDPRWIGLDSGPSVHAFDLHRVRLRAGPQLTALDANRRFMMGLDPDRLLHVFRVNAGLPSTAEPLGGWEAPVNELRGHFVGHYLSACALMGAQTGDAAVKARGAHMVEELSKCQAALGKSRSLVAPGTTDPSGYLSAFPTEFFERLKTTGRVWAPWYTYHKIMAGLLDSYTLSGNAHALEMVKGMAGWAKRWSDGLDEAQMQKVLDREFGGMNAVLYDLADVTHDNSYATLAHRFDHERVLAPLAAGRDELKGVHGNTTIPKIIGVARRHELTGEARSRDIARFFWSDVTSQRCFATGGTTNDESWNTEPGQLAKEAGVYTQESCVSYNMLKLTRQLFTWDPDPAYGDYYERTYFNGILPTQHPADGEKAYYTPMASGYWKLFGTPLKGFWCCHGSGVESFSKLADSVYFHDDAGVYVNLFVPSEVEWREKGVRIVQETTFPSSDHIALTVNCDKPTRMALRVRVPYWATNGGSATLNGRPAATLSAPSTWYIVDRTWGKNDKLELTLPMSLHTHPMPDDASMQAIMYGPLVLVGKLGTEGITSDNLRAPPTPPREVPEYKNQKTMVVPVAPTFVANSSTPATWIKPVTGKALEFRTVGQVSDVTFVPLYTLFDERYGVYWKIARG